jgi:hypothetical protein
MPQPSVYLGKIRNTTPLKQAMQASAFAERPTPVAVKFDYDREAVLDPGHRRATVWADMLDYLQVNNRPVYVEIDPDTNFIIKLYMPRAANVIQIQPSDSEEVVYIGFSTSHATHYLNRHHPDFPHMLDALQQAKDTDTTILVTATHQDFEIIDVRPLPPSYGNEGPPEPPPPPVPDPPVSWDRAVELFNMMNADTCTPCAATSPCIPFKYPRDGCWIRAHLMCYKLISEGETPEKIWISGSGALSLIAASSNVPDCGVRWNWHVAPTLMVTPEGGGADVKMVIDPSLCTEPVTVDFWKGLQSDPAATLTPSSWDAYAYLASGTASQSTADSQMGAYRLYLNELCADYGPSPYSCPIVKKCFFITDRSTISKDEVDAMLFTSNPAVIEAALYVVVEGFTPAELGITTATLSGIPNIHPNLTPASPVAQMTIGLMPNLGLEYPTKFNRPQRITWKYKISFTGSTGFVAELAEVNLSASISTVMGTAKLYLIKQPNPYEIDGATSWLSTDLRVFQIRTGESKFNSTMAADGSAFITNVINNLNTGNTGGQTFEGNISTDQQTSRLELSQSVGGVNVYNFAVAKVRYRALSVSATNVRVFFRLFQTSSTSMEFNQSTTYRRATQGGSTKPLLGIVGGETATIPCFAAPRVDTLTVSMADQSDPANVQVLPPNAGGTEVVRYFGCWLDINQTQPQFPISPISPIDGPYASASRKSIQELVRNEHQCLVAEIAFDPTPVPANASPSTSDKLAQRNLAIVQSDNPGAIASHRIPHTFEIKPTRVRQGSEELPDEIMIDWGNTPIGCAATLYIPGINTNDILALAIKHYRSHELVRIDAHTLRCETGGITYIPIPPGEGANYASLISIDLPSTVKKGQSFTTVIHQITGHVPRTPEPLTHIGEASIPLRGRHVLGSFQLTMPVTTKEHMLVHEEILLSNLRWILRAIPLNNRWYPVFNRYVNIIGSRVDALGGDSSIVVASPAGDWKEKRNKCNNLRLLTIVLLIMLIVALGALSGQLPLIVGAVVAALLIATGSYWIKHCNPGKMRILKALLIGSAYGAVILAGLLIGGLRTPQLVGVLIASAVVAVLAAIFSRGRS